MRPVKKWNPQTDNSIRAEYDPYQEAKPDLVRNLGAYCSYCEQRIVGESLHVEHVQYKDKYKSLATRWSNFLLSCQRCNGSDNKGTKDVDLQQIHLPHLNNTFQSLSYLEGGMVVVNPSLPDDERLKAQRLIDLVGLDKHPGHPRHLPKDVRWAERRRVWELAMRYRKHYEQKKYDGSVILDLSQNCGFWSVWMTVFQDCPEITRLLVDNFAGTASEYFYPPSLHLPR